VIADRYRVLRVLGEGGMGVVYEAEQQFLGRTVALKTLHGMFARKPEIVTRFQNEALAAAKVRNPHIVELFELGRLDDGSLFIAMEMLHGQELSKLIREGPLPVGRAVRIALQLCDALVDVHAAGIVHRDLKPANIFLVRAGTNEDFAKILDFGISKIVEADGSQDVTRTRSVLGTPHYMAPEQIGNARNVDVRADLYALGGILYRMLAGRTPFIEKDFTELAIQVKTLPAPDIRAMRPDLPEPLAQVIHACLAKPVEHRPSDARALRAALEPFAHLDAPPRLSMPPVPVGDLFASAPSGARFDVGSTVATSPPPTPALPPPYAHQGSIPGSMPGSIVVQSASSGILVLVSVLATVVVLGGLAIAAYVFTRPPPAVAAATPTTPIAAPAVTPAATVPPIALVPPRAPAAQPVAPPRPAAPIAPAPQPAAVAARPPRSRPREEPTQAPVAQASPTTPAAPPPASAPPQGVLVHAPIGSPF